MNSELGERIAGILQRAGSPDRVFPATTLYNEGWLLWLVLDWFSGQPEGSHLLSFKAQARWFSEGLLPTRFAQRFRGDDLYEARTHADGLIGHFTVGKKGKADIDVERSATQILITEAKLNSRLAANVRNASYFDQAARNVACLAEVIRHSGRKVEGFDSLGFFVLAPASQIEAGVFAEEVNKDSILEKVQRRVGEYNDPEMDRWFSDWFQPVLEKAMVECISWEEIVEHIGSVDKSFGEGLAEFYNLCLKFNGR